MAESLTVKSITTMINTDVTHAGTPSSIHMRAANTKMAIMRCWMTVRFSIPNAVEGIMMIISVTNSTKAIFTTFNTVWSIVPINLIYLGRVIRHAKLTIFPIIMNQTGKIFLGSVNSPGKRLL